VIISAPSRMKVALFNTTPWAAINRFWMGKCLMWAPMIHQSFVFVRGRSCVTPFSETYSANTASFRESDYTARSL